MLFADGEKIAIILHVSSVCEKQEYQELSARIILLNDTSTNSSSYY